MAEWTDERMDDLAQRVDAGFARNDHQIEALRTEMREGFRDVRAEFRGDIGRLEGNIGELRTLVFRFGIALVVGLVGLVAALAGAIGTGALSA